MKSRTIPSMMIGLLALGLLAGGGCAEGPTVRVHTDVVPTAEFSAFRTFAFSGMTDRGYEVGPSDTSPLRGRVRNMVAEQLAAKGLRQVSVEDRPDLLVHIFFGVKDTQHAETIGMTPGRPGVYVTTYEYQDGAWKKLPTARMHEDREGTLIVNLAESSNKKVVWRALIKAVLGDSLEGNFELAHAGIAQAFKDYPAAVR